jgi:hypothetical protein
MTDIPDAEVEAAVAAIAAFSDTRASLETIARAALAAAAAVRAPRWPPQQRCARRAGGCSCQMSQWSGPSMAPFLAVGRRKAPGV